MSIPISNADMLALQGWVNREGIIPLSGQRELREAVGRVLSKTNLLWELYEALLSMTDAENQIIGFPGPELTELQRAFDAVEADPEPPGDSTDLQ